MPEATMEKPVTVTLASRSEVPQSDCWDLSSLYAKEADWEKEFAKAEELVPQVAAYAGRLAESAATVRAYLELDVQVTRMLEKLYNYAARKSDEDTSDSHYMGLKDRITGLNTRFAEAMSFFNAELLALPDETLNTYIASEELAPFRFNVERIVREKPYTLSVGEERVLALAGDVTRAPYDSFGQLNNADLRFGFVEDEQGRRVEVTHGSYGMFLQKPQREIRKAFFEKYYEGFEAHKHTLAAMLASGVRANMFYAKARGFESARARALHKSNIPEAVYDTLVEATRDNVEPLYKYYDLRKRVLELDEVHFYDLLVPAVADIELHHSYDEAVGVTVAALAPLGEDYTKTLEHGLRHGWVDRYENRGKRSGAYSAGCYDSEPFILLNFKEEVLDHVYTLAHEAGHSMHTWHSARNQPPQYYNYPIFLAEVASTFNEVLLTHHLLAQTDDPRMKAYIISKEIDDFRSTFFRQVMFADFEHTLHAHAEAKKPLSLDEITGLYHELLERYHGPRFTLDPQLDLECFRIPHFYYNFYVFQYATGLATAIALAERVLHGGATELEAYKGFLGAGESRYAIDILRSAGVDMTTREPIEAALRHFAKRVDELEELLS